MVSAAALVFGISFLFNTVWEFAHSQLYTTCRTMEWPALAKLLARQSIKDAVWITLAHTLTPNIYMFSVVLLVFSFLVEKHALHTKRWEYAPEMPRVFGVGVTPLLELAMTGVVATLLTAHILSI